MHEPQPILDWTGDRMEPCNLGHEYPFLESNDIDVSQIYKRPATKGKVKEKKRPILEVI